MHFDTKSETKEWLTELSVGSESKIFFKNIVLGLLYQIVLLASGFIVPKLILQSFGTEVTGLISSISQITTYYSVLEAGLSQALIISLYKPIIDNDYETINGILNYSRKFYNKVAGILILITAITAAVYPLVINRDKLSYTFALSMFLILGAVGIIDFLSVKRYSIILTADKKFGLIQLAMSIQLILRCIVMVTLINLGTTILIIEIASVATVLIVPLTLKIYCRKHYTYLDYHRDSNITTIPQRYDALIHQVTALIQQSAPIIIATFLLPLSEVGIISFYFIVIRGIDGLLSLVTASISNFGHMYARKEIAVLSNAFEQLELVYCIVCVTVFSVMTANFEPFIKLFTGYSLTGVAIMLTIRGLLICLRRPHMILLNSAGLYKYARPYTITQTVILILASPVLGLKFGILGILAGDILSNLYRNVEILVHIPQKVGISTFSSVRKQFTAVVGFAFILVTLPIFKPVIPQITNYTSWVFFSICASVYALSINIVTFLITDRSTCKKVYISKISQLFARFGKKNRSGSNNCDIS